MNALGGHRKLHRRIKRIRKGISNLIYYYIQVHNISRVLRPDKMSLIFLQIHNNKNRGLINWHIKKIYSLDHVWPNQAFDYVILHAVEIFSFAILAS